MTETIQKLLRLQERDRQIRRVQAELDHIEPEQQMLRARAVTAQAELDNARARLRQIGLGRDGLELEIKAKKELVTRYSLQQFQTRKNEEYRALAHEIQLCKEAIFKLEDQEIALMEQEEAVQKEISRATQAANDTRQLVADQLAQLATREQNLKMELAGLQANREDLAAAVGETERARYDRLVRSRGEHVVVGVQHGVCGGCHMRLPPQLLVFCQAEKEIITCSNCGRVLFYTPDMDLAAVD
ncbi:MAG: C4-type zinc ribbon domain-containing protein [Verrucomicrobiota bacterium]|jgi:predicted  nucleic acid-binding Zn-ribbon protein